MEVVHTYAVFCPQYRKDVVACGTALEAIIPPHTHTGMGTPSVAGTAIVIALTSVGTTHEVRLGENLFLSDGEASLKPVRDRQRDLSGQTRRDAGVR